ncbi:hypothetical protein AX15_001377 [Amanita polypyramis BW_CC]|nr:hypothetical protein AX15_001377 [Amanita polypyramis BW_CC]
MTTPAPTLSRTSSTTSISSTDDTATNRQPNTVSRRTRRRFTSMQLAMLESLFHQNSHPSREEREAVAKAGGMEVKSVTIWFQNKRQTERRVALLNSSDATRALVSTTSLASTRTHSPTYSTTSPRPSLDRIASRTELRTSTPRTPTRRRDPGANLWDNMPSSPIASPVSPPLLEYVGQAKNQRGRRSLEWACAAARLAEKEGISFSNTYPRRTRTKEQRSHHHHHHHRHHRRHHHHRQNRSTKVDADLTEEEPEEIITPNGSWTNDDDRWIARPDGAMQAAIPPVLKSSQGGQDDDVMRAAEALCGLGRRSL